MAPLRAERRFICQHLSGYGKCFEVYYRSFRAADEGFHFYCLEAGGGIIAPHCTGGSWGWRLAAARGAYRLLARCEILPCMLCLLVPDLLLPREMGCLRFPPRKKACTLVFYYPLSVSGWKEKHAYPLFFLFWGMWLSGMSLSLFLMISYKYKSGIVAFDLPQHHNKNFIASCGFHHKEYWLASFPLKPNVSL